MSAATFIVINNLTKFLNIFLGMIFLNDRIAGLMDGGGCVIAIVAGCWYSFATMKLNDKLKRPHAAGHK